MNVLPTQLQTAQGLPSAPTDLATWRQRLLERLLGVIIVAGWLVALPSIALAVYERLWPLVVVDVVALGWLSLIYRKRQWDYRWRTWQLLALLYLISVVLLLTIGHASQIYLMALPVLAVLLLSLRAAIGCLVLNALTLALVGTLLQVDSGMAALGENPLLRWGAITLNFLLIDTALTIACAFLLHGMERALAEQQANARLLEHQAMHDTLTGLANRRLLDDRVHQAIAQAQRQGGVVGLVLLDLDHFKLVNDGHGHELGDALIVACAQRLTAAARAGDTVARFGGDEFVVVLTGLRTESELPGAIERLHGAIGGRYELPGHELHVGTSMGVAVYPRDGADATSLIKSADTAMYRAKEKGRDGFQFFQAEMNDRLAQRLQLENALRDALERDQLRLHFQPRVGASDGRPRGGEALLRWHHPELGLISPAQFIPIAEETGLIVPIGEWVVRTAAEHLAQWQQEFPVMCLSVNISPRQFRAAGLEPAIRAACARVAPGTLEVEITESLVMHQPDAAFSLLRQWRALGVGVAMDDFGTGFSSLARLKSFPLDVLKIDQSFVRGIGQDASDAAIVKTIVDLAGNLGLTTVAEGVETDGQASILRKLGVHELQGYLLARPMPADDYLAWWRAQAAAPSGGHVAE
ncbi:MAG: EAL domain-containing protein [Rhodocyclaceae bacterium]|nr:EAL domain-containing protein [Rhodocyclaceae bacterium]